ncbi:M20/M25/M40 family metallo-hydrolase [Alicyclobacillus sp. SO9]|uniref:M20/M25/M40 family metallo-hydrolase n=1 Tax=Alicyclobacillus sp. SO9 TaxID=2665646 RepID=UPI0018E729E4|nr:M20/M25/M40 family metallo-hydrolase [Alicyclobacillus sp. SO9]QQE77135.1 M20/M25/M40 family metallo-hydrolase [Alicyclobacillus sp. SO9]
MTTRKRTHIYETPEQKLDTLFQLVRIESVTESEGEIAIAHELERMIRDLPYYCDNPEHLVLHEVGNYRKVVAALAKSPRATRKTAVVIAHFDVVAADEFGVYAPYAFQPQVWTEMIYKEEVPLPDYVREDISSGDWVFGRGVMDMKCGIVLNLSLLEQACNGDFDGNVLFLGVPDEERHSDGMIGAGPLLLEWKEKFNLDYSICIDTEPAFAEHEEDGALIYSGTIGKLLVGSYAIGRETHVGSPFEGLSGVRMIAELTRTLELNPDLVEWVGPDHTPPIACLQNRDLKMHYSVQTPYKAGAYYNLFFLQRSPAEVLTQVKAQAENSMFELSSWYQGRIESAGLALTNWADETRVMTLAELEDYVREAAPELIDRGLEMISISHGTDLRETTMSFVDHLASAVPELHPLVVLFFAPPFYPAISSAEDVLVQRVMDRVTKQARDSHDVHLLRRNYFPGLCDLSYVGLGSAAKDAKDLEANMPLLGSGYDLPLDVLRQLEIPVLNIGPYGRDPHKWTERLELNYSFGVTPNLLTSALHEVFEQGRE